MNSKSTQHYIPIINSITTTNEEKVNQFREILLSAFSSLSLTDISDIIVIYIYPEPMSLNSIIIKQQLERAVGKLASNKISNPDKITN